MRAPDFVIGPPGAPYLLRWWVIPRNRWFNIYLHNMLRDDDDRALHDHPWVNVSIILSGGYHEHMPARGWCKYLPLIPRDERMVWRGPGVVVFRYPTDCHRLSLGSGPSWSLFITGPVMRSWGFWCPKGWRHWREFTSERDYGQVGRGCE